MFAFVAWSCRIVDKLVFDAQVFWALLLLIQLCVRFLGFSNDGEEEISWGGESDEGG